MARIRRKMCPNCKKVLAVNDSAHYGSPLRQCGHCGKTYKDTDYREIAVEGIRPNDDKVLAPGLLVIALIGLGIWVYDLIRNEYGIEVFLIVFFVLIPLYHVLTAKRRLKKLCEETVQSENRLKNPAYALLLKNMGYDVPEKYLPKQ